MTKLLKEKEGIIENFEARLKECQLCKEKSEQILELVNEKSELDKECDTLLSWGRGCEESNAELVDRLAALLKDLVDTKLKVYEILIEKIQFVVSIVFECVVSDHFFVFVFFLFYSLLRFILILCIEFFQANLSKEQTTSLDNVTAEQIEMQLSSKEKATRNAKARVEALVTKIKGASCDFDLLQSLCSELHKENEIISNLDEECLCIWENISRKESVVSITFLNFPFNFLIFLFPSPYIFFLL